MKIAIAAIATVAGAASAAPYFAQNNGYTGVGQTTAGTIATATIDISGIQTWDEYGSAFNTVMNVNLAANAHVIGIGWDVGLFAGLDLDGASWGSEATIAFEDSAQASGVFLAPVADSAPGTFSSSSGGIIDLTTLTTPLDFFLNADGILRLEFFEDFVDDAGIAEAEFLSGSTLQVQYVAVPAPSALAALGLGGLVAGRRRR